MRIATALLALSPGAALAHHDDLGVHLVEVSPVVLPLLVAAVLLLRAGAARLRPVR